MRRPAGPRGLEPRRRADSALTALGCSKEKRLAAQYRIVSGLADTTRVESAALQVLKETCSCVNWDLGAFWKVDSTAQILHCVATWEGVPGRTGDFLEHSRRLTFGYGEGLPGRIWASGDPLWLPELAAHRECPRFRHAQRAGLRAAFGCPVQIYGEVLAVAEFFSQVISKPDHGLLSLMTTIAGHMAQFMRRMEVEEQRRLTEERLKAILNNTTSVIYVKDVQGRYLMANRRFERLFHLEEQAALGKTDYELFPQEAAAGFTRNDQTVVRLGQTVEFEETAPHPDGPHTYISVKFPLHDPNGTICGVCGVSTDITERKNTEKELVTTNAQLLERNLEFERSERALRQALGELRESHRELKVAQKELLDAARLKSAGQLAAGVAHEVKNPLQTILMGIAYLSRNLPEAEEVSTAVLTDMKDAVARADTIVRDLLTLSATRPLELAEADLHALLNECLRLVMFELNRVQISVVLDLAPDVPRLHLDKARIQELFINLFMNAIHAMPDGGQLTVRSRLHRPTTSRSGPGQTAAPDGEERSEVVVEVEDSGVGMPAETLDRIFEPFFTTKPTGQGTGLGLPICRQIMDAHGGTIEISLIEVGGVRVRVTFRT